MPVNILIYRLMHPLLRLYWFVVRPHTYGVKVIIQRDDKILLIRNSYGNRGLWTFPGGGYRTSKEAAEEAVIREVNEELSLQLCGVREIGVCEREAEYKKDTITFFTAEAVGEIQLSAELQDAQWYSIEDIDYLDTGEIYRIGIGYLTNI